MSEPINEKAEIHAIPESDSMEHSVAHNCSCEPELKVFTYANFYSHKRLQNLPLPKGENGIKPYLLLPTSKT